MPLTRLGVGAMVAVGQGCAPAPCADGSVDLMLRVGDVEKARLLLPGTNGDLSALNVQVIRHADFASLGSDLHFHYVGDDQYSIGVA